MKILIAPFELMVAFIDVYVKFIGQVIADEGEYKFAKFYFIFIVFAYALITSCEIVLTVFLVVCLFKFLYNLINYNRPIRYSVCYLVATLIIYCIL